MYEKETALLNKTKGRLFFYKNAGFLCSIINSLGITWDDTIPTACVSATGLRWNPEFFMSLDEETRVTVLAHEAWHIGFMHLALSIGLNQDVYNQAADYVINLMLKDQGYFMGGFPYLLDSKYRGMSTFQVYEELMKNPPSPPEGGLGPDIEPSGMTEEQKTEMITTVVTASTVARVTNTAGDIPGEVSLIIEEFLNPKLPWEQLLAKFFNDVYEQHRSYAAPSRRYSGPDDPMMPGLSGTSSLDHIVFFQDISGSVSDEDIMVLNSECKHVWDTYNPRKLTIITFDTKIQDIYEFADDDTYESIKVTGRGGTNLHHVYKYMNENQPDAAIIFTDLYVDIPQQAPNCPLLWVCINNPNSEVPHGDLVHLNYRS